MVQLEFNHLRMNSEFFMVHCLMLYQKTETVWHNFTPSKVPKLTICASGASIRESAERLGELQEFTT